MRNFGPTITEPLIGMSSGARGLIGRASGSNFVRGAAVGAGAMYLGRNALRLRHNRPSRAQMRRYNG